MNTLQDKDFIPVESLASIYRGDRRLYALVAESEFPKRILYVGKVERNRRSWGFIEFSKGIRLNTRLMTVGGTPAQVFKATTVVRCLWEMQQWRMQIQLWADSCGDLAALRAAAELVGESAGFDWHSTMPKPPGPLAGRSWRESSRTATRDWLCGHLKCLSYGQLRSMAAVLTVGAESQKPADGIHEPTMFAA